jgi:two-component system nitrogen regulation response regulator GlnG
MASETMGNDNRGLSASVEKHLRLYFEALGPDRLGTSGLYAQILREIERPLLRLTLDQCRGNQLRAAALLGLNRNTLRKKLRDLGLEAGRKIRRGTSEA